MPRVALLFIDGVGAGERDPAKNPLARRQHFLSQFRDGTGEPLPEGGRSFLVDTSFSVPGRPQSASNQTALLTGEPAPQIIGHHVLGFPDAPLRQLLLERSIVRRVTAAGRTATFANGFPASYLDTLGLRRRPGETLNFPIPPGARRRLKPSATTLSMAAADIPLRTLDDVVEGAALSHDIDGGRARSRGIALPSFDADTAADVFWSIATGHHFTLFEHFLADEAGHARDEALALAALDTFDAFARAVVRRRPADAHVLICSDHGNVEDLSTRNHTLNPVATLWFGPDDPAALRLETVADVGRLVLRLLAIE